LVVPVYQVEAYLGPCLDSILRQPFGDFEVILVDDCSTDGSVEIIAGYAERDDRIAPVRLEVNSGLGAARNAGLRHAKGEYVWFIDADDWLAEGALEAVAGRLHDIKPDVLVVDYLRAQTGGRIRPSGEQVLLGQAPQAFSLDGYPLLLTGFCVAWNKVVRTQFLMAEELSFPRGWYEDVPFAFPLLAKAGRISALDRVCVYYRQHRNGSITGTTSRRHIDLISQYELAMRRIGPVWVAEYVRRQAVRHGLQVLASHARLPADFRREFFLRLAAFADRHDAHPGGLKDFLLRWRAWEVYRGLQVGKRLLHRARSHVTAASVRRVGRKVGRLPRLGYYWWQRHRPLEELALYSAYWGRAYECNPAAIHAAATRLAPKVRSVWAVNADQAGRLPSGVDHVVVGSFAYYRAMARARWLINNANFDDEIVKRTGTIHVQTNHGTPLKFMGVDEPAYHDSPERLLKRCSRWDFSLVSNRYSERVWRRAYPCRFDFLEYGYPRNDVLVNATPDLVAQLRCSYPDGLLVLHAATHRGQLPAPALPEIPGVTVLEKTHYLVAGGGRGPAIEELMLVSDVLVTDYSSVMFDYALLDRPIVIYAPDWQEYMYERGVYFDLVAHPPGVVARTPHELVTAFESGAVWRSRSLRAAFRERFCEFDDGHAAEKVVRRVILGESLDGDPP
jgi:CDP-glycerol glycerophosphotransferase